jgi:hypothetical protein
MCSANGRPHGFFLYFKGVVTSVQILHNGHKIFRNYPDIYAANNELVNT